MVKNKPGRPPLDPSATSPSADVHVTLSAVDYDAGGRLAKQRREKIQDVLRLGLKRLIRDERGGAL